MLRFNHGFADDLRAGRTARLQVLVDGTDSNTAEHRAELRRARSPRPTREQILVERFERRWGRRGKPGRVDLRTPGVVQREPGKPQLLRARRAGDRRRR